MDLSPDRQADPAAVVLDPAAASVIDARGVVKSHAMGDREVHALRGVDVRVDHGEMVAVVGPSGSGKTTLLNCLAGLDSIDAGRVTIVGEDVHAMPERRRTRLRGREMGFVFQAFNLVPVLSAVENVELPLLLGGSRPRSARARAERVLDRVGLGDRRDHRPATLSGGEQQRVAIARALVTDPAVVWADEPTGSLDSVTAGQVMDLFGELHADGLTVVLVTHDLDVAARADRILSMRDGAIVGQEVAT